jgi:putative acetyltransferase
MLCAADFSRLERQPIITRNMQAITIRPYRLDDVGSLVALFRASVRQTALGDYTAAQVQAWAPDLIDLEQFGNRCASKSTWVAESASEIAGFSDLESDGHVDMLYVHPTFQRRSVARALLSHIEGIARRQGLDRLYTEASTTARPAFEAIGFIVLEARTVVIRGESMTNYRMEKRLVRPSS